MSHTGDEFAGPAKQLSGWLIPLTVFLVTAALSALFLIYYLAPLPPELIAEQPAPTDSTAPVALSVGGTVFHIPSSYIVFASARRGGPRESLDMAVLLPDLQGYSLELAQEFASNAPDSRVVNVTVREDARTLTEQEKLQRIYMPQVETNTTGPAPVGLTLYNFRADSGYRDEELYVGDTGEGLILLRCTKQSFDVPSPSCLVDMALNSELSITYRFKRTHLERWHEVDSGIRALVGAFMDKS